MRARTRLIIFSGALIGAVSYVLFPAAPASAERPDPAAHVLDVPAVAFPAGSVSAPSTPASVTVRSGDDLSGIAERLGRSWQQLAGYNHLTWAQAQLIRPGQVLSVPPAGYQPPAYSAPEVTSAVKIFSPMSHPAVSAASYSPSGVWACIAEHESGGNPAENTGNGYYGMYQFDYRSWLAAGGGRYASRADLASAAEQTLIAERWQSMAGWGAWPVTSRECGV